MSNSETSQQNTVISKDALTGLEDEILQKKRKTPVKLIFALIAVSVFYAGFNLSLFFDTVMLKSYLCAPQVFNCPINLDGTYKLTSQLTSATSAFNITKAAGTLFFMVSLIVGGAYSDDLRTRFGNRVPMIFIGAIVSGLGYILLPIIVVGSDPTIVMIMGIIDYAIIYTGMGVALAPEYALISELFTKEERGLVGMGFAGIGLIGTVCGIIIQSEFYSPFQTTPNFINWYFIGLFVGLFIIILGVITSVLTPKYNPPFPGDGTIKDIIATPRYLFQMGGSSGSNNDFLLMFIVGILWGGGAFLISLGLPDYVDSLRGLTGSTVTIEKQTLLIILGVSAALFAGPVGIVIAKLGKIKSGIAGSILLGFFTFMIGQTFVRSDVPIILLTLIAGVGVIFITAVNISLPADLVPRGKEAQFMGLFSVAANIMAPLAGAGASVILNDAPNITEGYASVFLITTIFYFGAVFILLFMHYEDQLEGEYQTYYRRYLIMKGFVSDKTRFAALKVSSSLKMKKTR